jgi:hypothetical protein
VYPPLGGCTLATSVSAGVAGSTVTVTGSGFDPGSVAIFFDSAQVGSATASAQGSFSVDIVVPSSATPGIHEIKAVPADGKCDPFVTFTVTAAAPATGRSAGGSALAFTGSDSLLLLWIALAMLTVGTTLVLAVRRRARTRRSLST